MAEVYVSIEGCDNSTNFYLVCTDEQLKFLKEISKMTNQVSEYSCMPVVKLFDLSGEEAENIVEEGEPFKAKLSVEDNELDTTNL